MGLLQSLFKENKLPTVETVVTIEKKSMAALAVTVVIVATIIILLVKVSRKL